MRKEKGGGAERACLLYLKSLSAARSQLNIKIRWKLEGSA